MSFINPIKRSFIHLFVFQNEALVSRHIYRSFVNTRHRRMDWDGERQQSALVLQMDGAGCKEAMAA